MKRPRWLGGPGGGAGDGGERPAKAGEEKPETAAARSARRLAGKRERGAAAGGSSEAARRRLADRVGRTGGDGTPGAEPERDQSGKPAAKPEAAGREKPQRTGKAEDPERTAKPRKPRPEKGQEAAKVAPERKLHRPRRQPEAKPRESRGEAKEQSPEAKPKEKAEPEGRPGARSRKPAEPEGRKRREETARRKRRRSGGRSGRRAGARAKAGAATFAGALERGAVATRKSAAENAPKAGRALVAALAAVFALFFDVLGFVLNVLIAAGRVVAGPVRATLRVLDRAARATSRVVTPARALAVVVAGAAVLLALSQYADYRSISIGNDAYSGVQTVAPAPETGRLQTGDAHSYVFVPVAIACLLLLAVATIGRRWQACRLITLAGIAAIAVALLVDRPTGLDPGDAAVAFEGVHATLIGGFYAQIAAGILLIGSSTLLARELRLAAAPQPAGANTPRREPASKQGRRRPARPGAGPEGTARA